MQILSHKDALQALCKATGKYGALISLDSADPKDRGVLNDQKTLQGAAPYLHPEDEAASDIFWENYGYLLFESRSEAWDAFFDTVGENGPTHTNPYKGPAIVNMWICNPLGCIFRDNQALYSITKEESNGCSNPVPNTGEPPTV